MPKIIHLTDLHICPEGETVLGLDPRKRLLAAFDSINRHHADADLCVITGDLTNHGDAESYKILRFCLEQLRLPWRLLLGNHDNRANFLSVFPETLTDPTGFVQSAENVGGSRLLFLDTLDSELDGAGSLCRNRMVWLEKTIGESRMSPVFLFMHHPPRSVGVRYFDHMLLSNSDSFMALVAASPTVSHIAFGHLHLTATGSWGTASFSCNRGTCHKISLNLSELRAEYVQVGPAYDVMLIDEGRAIVHHVDPVGTAELLATEYPDRPGGRIVYPARDGTPTVEL